MEAAFAEFAARGYLNASIEDIAARADVTKGAVYYYFADKNDLASDLEAQLWDRLGAAAAEHFDPAASTLDNLKFVFRAFLAALDDHAQARFVLRDCWAAPGLEAGGRREEERGVVLVQKLIEGGIAAGEIADVDARASARLLIAVFAEATLHSLRVGTTDEVIHLVERMIDSLGVRGGRPRALDGDARSRPIRAGVA